MRDGQPHIVPLLAQTPYIASSLYAPDRSTIPNWLGQQLPEAQRVAFQRERIAQLKKGQSVLRELAVDGISNELLFGKSALDTYLEDPSEGYYIKSPKSFLGANSLLPVQIQLFEDIVTAMMSNVKTLTEANLGREITRTVIGRPINFQGLHSEKSNQQALKVLTNAAKRVGFKQVEFQYEPVAAGFEFEATLTKESRVLVVDIGGGTSDCSMLLMGPEFKTHIDRTAHLLAHSGVRVAGNDFDIQLALQGIMPSLGMNSVLKTGKPMPKSQFYQALAINNIKAQTDFYSRKNRRELTQLIQDEQETNLVSRLLSVHDHKLSYQLVNCAEQAKIALSDCPQHTIELDNISQDLSIQVTSDILRHANHATLSKIGKLMKSVINQAQCQPDVIFVTGGTAKSPVLTQFIQQQMPKTPVVTGDHFGSVTAGLARRAEMIYR